MHRKADDRNRITIPMEKEFGVSESKKSLPLPGTCFKIDGCEAFLIEPDGERARGPWVWYAPTLPPYPDVNEKWMFERFLEAGISIAGIDVGESSGNPEGRRLYTSFYTYLTTQRGLSEKAALLPRSRGGLMLYNWAAENAEKVACIAGIYPVCNLKSFPGLERASEAYGMTPKMLEAEISQHNPIDRLESLAAARVPIYHVQGDEDEPVPLEANSQILAERYRALGGDVTLNIAQGQGHSVWEGFFQCQELIDFVKTHAISE
jgi:pimeloyl-ACP methyl ester carboxylesterase